MGFDAVGFVSARKLDHLSEPYNEWLRLGYHGQMSWLEENVDKRLDPRELVPGTKTIISLASFYYSDNYSEDCGVSRYAVSRDYHKVLKRKGRDLVVAINQIYGPCKARVFVDSAPVMEREWGRLAGLGWIGKNGCLIIPQKGSWFFLSEILVDVDFPSDEIRDLNLCGSCTRCIQACPTDALLGGGLLDANKCISYLTIEHKGEFDPAHNPRWEDWIFGCDICQEVCPWNRKPIQHSLADFDPRVSVMNLKSELLKSGNQESIEEKILGTPLKRTGTKGLIRNYNWIDSISE